MTETPLPGDIRQIDIQNELLIDDTLPADHGDGEDVGTFDPGDDFDDTYLEDTEIDELPEVGEVDIDEEPILDEVDDGEWNPEWDKTEEEANG